MNTVTQNEVRAILDNSEFEWQFHFGKTLIGVCKLPNGFVLVESSSCVDPANYSEEIGKAIIMTRFENKVWELEGYVLQKKVSE